MTTIKEAADEKAKEYFDLYKRIKANPFYKDMNVESLAEYDLLVKKLVYEMALEKLREMIKKNRS